MNKPRAGLVQLEKLSLTLTYKRTDTHTHTETHKHKHKHTDNADKQLQQYTHLFELAFGIECTLSDQDKNTNHVKQQQHIEITNRQKYTHTPKYEKDILI